MIHYDAKWYNFPLLNDNRDKQNKAKADMKKGTYLSNLFSNDWNDWLKWTDRKLVPMKLTFKGLLSREADWTKIIP